MVCVCVCVCAVLHYDWCVHGADVCVCVCVCVCAVLHCNWCVHLHFTFTFSHLADAFIQSDLQRREQSSYEQYRPGVTINTILHKKLKKVQECNYCKCELSTS